jgi:aldehyde dehydrogenase (NAD+)
MSFLDYALDPASPAILKLPKKYGLFIGSEFVDGHGDPFHTVAPATEKKIVTVAHANPADIDAAVEVARTAYERVWSKLSQTERGKYLFRIARLIQERAHELAVAESLNTGKPITENSTFDIPLAAAWFFYYAGWADKLDHAGLGPQPQALGVVAQVISCNSPLLMLACVIAPALAAGNTVVLKPAEKTPLTALLFADILQQVELPAGVVNIITGGDETGRLLVTHPAVSGVAFTGSTATGHTVARSLVGTNKKFTLHCAGTGVNIVFDDAPIDQAIEGIIAGGITNQGQMYGVSRRLLVQENVHDDVVERLKNRLGSVRLGDPLDKNTDVGALNTAGQRDRLRDLSHSAEAEGAEQWTLDCHMPSTGFWFPPTIFTHVSPSSRLARETVIGPMLSVLTFRTPAEAIAKANNTPQRLSASIWSDKTSRALAVANGLRAEMVWVNTINRYDPASPLNSYQQSGYDRENAHHNLAVYLRNGASR